MLVKTKAQRGNRPCSIYITQLLIGGRTATGAPVPVSPANHCSLRHIIPLPSCLIIPIKREMILQFYKLTLEQKFCEVNV